MNTEFALWFLGGIFLLLLFWVLFHKDKPRKWTPGDAADAIENIFVGENHDYIDYFVEQEAEDPKIEEIRKEVFELFKKYGDLEKDYPAEVKERIMGVVGELRERAKRQG